MGSFGDNFKNNPLNQTRTHMPSRTHLVSVLAAVLALPSLYAQGTKPTFSGTWELDQKRSEGVPPGTQQVLVVNQAGERLDVEVKISGPGGDQTLTDLYVLNGKETEFTPPLIGGGKSKGGKRTATLAANGMSFDATEEAMVE